MISDWEYLLDDGSDLAMKIKEIVQDANYHYMFDFWAISPAETIESVTGDYREELQSLLTEYSLV